MQKWKRYYFIICIVVLTVIDGTISFAQQPRPRNISFNHLSKANGLSDNYIWDMCIDRNGLLWIATGDGLCNFDGKTVNRYFTNEYPQLKNNHMRQVVCDYQNRIWVLQEDGFLTMVDEYRRFQFVRQNDNKPLQVKRIIKTDNGNIFLFTKEIFLKVTIQPPAQKNNLSKIVLSDYPLEGFNKLKDLNFLQYEIHNDQNIFFVSETELCRINISAAKIEKIYPLAHTVVLNWKDERQVMAFDKEKRRLFLFNKSDGSIAYPFDRLTDNNGNSIRSIITNSLMIDPHTLLLATSNEGIFIYSLKERRLYNYRHNISDETSIANNSPKVIVQNSNGRVFLSSTPNGISYFNNKTAVVQQLVFQNEKGSGYDGHINSIASFDDKDYFIGVSSTLIKWNSETNTSVFLGSHRPTSELLADGVRAVACDKQGQIWVSVPRLGVFVRDKSNRFIRHFFFDSSRANNIPSNHVLHLSEQGSYIWLTSANGVCRVNTKTLKIVPLPEGLMKKLNGKTCNISCFTDSTSIWVATHSGAVYYNFITGATKEYDTSNGLGNGNILYINKDLKGNIYFGSTAGLHILMPDNKWKNFSSFNGLLNERVDIIVTDDKGRMWIGNGTGLACYNSDNGELNVFDEHYGLSVNGFRGYAFHKTRGGELMWGTEKGLQFFSPDSLLAQKPSYNFFVSRVESKNKLAGIASDTSLNLATQDNNLAFYFALVDYNRSSKTFFQYKLEGAEKEWNSAVDLSFVRYSSLRPGRYSFFIKASNDNINWVKADNKVVVFIEKPWWQQVWAKLLGILVAATLFLFVLNHYRKRQRQKTAELETELVITYFASQIHSRLKTDDLLWDVAKNLIGKMGFEDCMIYLWDEDKKMLLQKAGYGLKGSMEAVTDKNTYHIPKGKGIVGYAVESKQSVLVNDTSADKRYFTADGKIMLSELCVPLVYDNEVLGAIKIEHKQKNIFTARHQKTLTAIASLCAKQLIHIRTEEEKQQATIEALKNKQKAAETRLQSLRLQMNPHFLFNALNSVQQMILANEEMVATSYLSRFSKLLRAILMRSDKEAIPLKEELEMLELYVKLESTRFKESFDYVIQCDESIDEEEVKVPTLLIQPFVENAIWHGLMHKEGNRCLKVLFNEEGEYIKCIVEDNGIGRKATRILRKDNAHVSRGVSVSEERLKMISPFSGRQGYVQFIDLVDENNTPSGTRVEIFIPF
jgi:ligand-binding sensor domain-containing protein/putative methionine-R-sulfoxide reductase with GAF domain